MNSHFEGAMPCGRYLGYIGTEVDKGTGTMGISDSIAEFASRVRTEKPPLSFTDDIRSEMGVYKNIFTTVDVQPDGWALKIRRVDEMTKLIKGALEEDPQAGEAVSSSGASDDGPRSIDDSVRIATDVCCLVQIRHLPDITTANTVSRSGSRVTNEDTRPAAGGAGGSAAEEGTAAPGDGPAAGGAGGSAAEEGTAAPGDGPAASGIGNDAIGENVQRLTLEQVKRALGEIQGRLKCIKDRVRDRGGFIETQAVTFLAMAIDDATADIEARTERALADTAVCEFKKDRDLLRGLFSAQTQEAYYGAAIDFIRGYRGGFTKFVDATGEARKLNCTDDTIHRLSLFVIAENARYLRSYRAGHAVEGAPFLCSDILSAFHTPLMDIRNPVSVYTQRAEIMSRFVFSDMCPGEAPEPYLALLYERMPGPMKAELTKIAISQCDKATEELAQQVAGMVCAIKVDSAGPSDDGKNTVKFVVYAIRRMVIIVGYLLMATIQERVETRHEDAREAIKCILDMYVYSLESTEVEFNRMISDLPKSVKVKGNNRLRRA